MSSLDRQRTLTSVAVMLGLAGIIATHVMDLPGKLSEVPYMGLMYIGVILAAGYLMRRIVTRGDRMAFLGSAALAAAVFAGYVINRTVGMPGATDDIGNWMEPLGVLALVCEAFVVWQGIAAARLVMRSTPVAAMTLGTPVTRERVSAS